MDTAEDHTGATNDRGKAGEGEKEREKGSAGKKRGDGEGERGREATDAGREMEEGAVTPDENIVRCHCGCNEVRTPAGTHPPPHTLSLSLSLSLSFSPQDDGLMVLCAGCNLWQHAVCFTLLAEEDVPETHICAQCAQQQASRLKFQTDLNSN